MINIKKVTPESVLKEDYYDDLMRNSFNIGKYNKDLIREAMKEYAILVSKILINNIENEHSIKVDDSCIPDLE